MEAQYNLRSPGKEPWGQPRLIGPSVRGSSVSRSSLMTAVKRLMREAKELHDATEEYFAQPLEVSFAVHARQFRLSLCLLRKQVPMHGVPAAGQPF